LAKYFLTSKTTAVEISSNAFEKAKDNLLPFVNRVVLKNADILEFEPMIEVGSYDVCVRS
jgi:tRNA1(Val) A37 N6-methylase TrmN6